MIPRVVNCASTWENHRAGSFDQCGGSLMLTAAVRGGVGCGMDSASDELACCEISNDMVQEQ